DEPVIGPGKLIDKRAERWKGESIVWRSTAFAQLLAGEKRLQGLHANHVPAPERDRVGREASDVRRPVRQRGLLALTDRGGKLIRRLAFRHDTVDDDVLLRQSDIGQLFVGSADLRERRALWPGDEDQSGQVRAGKRLDRFGVDGLLPVQPGHGAEAGCIPSTALEVVAPGSGKAQEADGVAGRRGVEEDMVVLRG